MLEQETNNLRNTMGPLQNGPATSHITASHGPDTYINKFYISEYSNRYGHGGFTPRTGTHRGTGYQSNFRPGVYYSRKVDEFDNPKMGKLLTDNYNSVTKIHFKNNKGSDGRDPFPKRAFMVKSGFVNDTSPTVPTVGKVRSVCVDTKYEGTIYPHLNPRLHQIRSKDPIARENAGHGPSFMSTENQSNFRGCRSNRMDLSTKTVGPKEESGFTHAFNNEPITFKPTEAYDGNYPGWYTWRPTGTSLMKTDFQPSRYLDGNEPFTTVPGGSDRNTGYTREIKPNSEFTARPDQVYTKMNQVQPLVQQRIKRQDPAEYSNLVHAKVYPSMSSGTYRGLQRGEETLTDKLGNVSIGRKEETGFTENNCRFVQTAETGNSLQRFNTEYTKRYSDQNPKGDDRMGHTQGNAMEQLGSGFTKATEVQGFGADINSTEQLRKLHPYVARSIKAKDMYYDSHVHDNKKNLITA